MKSTNPSTVDTDLAEIFWFNEDNVSRSTGLYRDDADRHSLVELLSSGWDGQLGRPAIRPLTDEEKKEATNRLNETWDELRSADLSEDAEKIRVNGESITISSPEKLRIFETIRVRNGKLVVPKYKATTCFRRGNVLLDVNTIRAKQKADLIRSLPCVPREYANAMEQYVDNIRENQFKTAGARKMSQADSIAAAKRLFELGASESKMSRAFGLKRGMAQKFHRICKLDATHPDLDIVGSVVRGDVNPKALDKEKVKGLLDKKANSDEVAAFLQNPNAGNKPKIMSRKEIEALAEQCPVELIKLAYHAVLKNDATILQPVVAKAAKINEAVNAAING